jgi:hypothetical protein
LGGASLNEVLAENIVSKNDTKKRTFLKLTIELLKFNSSCPKGMKT